ncbi:phage portal protein [Lactobacillus crispatus]|uniref:phage portal protein n=1 Tax=Lactobacillus crispatus TaxID=47770 RepID=UPI0018A97E2F|nr:phage portal protein [Lactobacillus crispatus]
MKVVKGRGLVTRNGTFIFPKDEELTKDELLGFIDYNTQNLMPKYRKNMELYLSKHEILKIEDKEIGSTYKLVVNSAKYIVDTYNGYFLGIPPKISLDKSEDNDKLQTWLNHVSFADKLNEISKQVDIYGRSIGFLYQNENAETGFTYLSPTKAFIIYDDTVERNPLAFVRYEYYDNENEYQARGKIYYSKLVYDFNSTNLDENPSPNPYQMIPAVEFYENEERQGVFDPVRTLIDAYDKALSQKADQVEYFDNAYLAMMGIHLPTDKNGNPILDIRKNRFLYLPNLDPQSNPDVKFIAKPDGDQMQENYLNRLDNLIYQISMIPNMKDQEFSGNASGVALEYKLLPMRNKSNNKERKFTKSLRALFRAVFSTGQVISQSGKDSWEDLQFQFTRNIPKDIAGSISAAKQAEGMISKRTQLSLLPFINDPDNELEQVDKEKQESIKQAREAADALPDYMKNGEGDDHQEE